MFKQHFAASKVHDRAIQHAKVREKLPPRTEPYWRQLSRGAYIGFRKTEHGEYWLARWRGTDGTRAQQALGRKASLTYDEAVTLAQEWFIKCGLGVVKSPTVEQACKAYVENRRVEKGEATAHDAYKRFAATVYGTPFGSIQLDKLRVHDVERWRNGLADRAGRWDDKGKWTHSSVNRYLKALKAALNYGYRREMCSTDGAWKRVPLFAAAEHRRERYLTTEQRSALVDACSAPVAALLRGLWYTGARPGELRKATVADLDFRSRTLRLRDDKGKRGGRVREFPLTDPAVFEFFKRQAKDKLPAAPVFASAQGKTIREHEISNEVKSVRRRLGLPDDVVAYTFRHCTISDWLSAGLPVADVAKVCGTSIEMISNHYHKFIPSNFGDSCSG